MLLRSIRRLIHGLRRSHLRAPLLWALLPISDVGRGLIVIRRLSPSLCPSMIILILLRARLRWSLLIPRVVVPIIAPAVLRGTLLLMPGAICISWRPWLFLFARSSLVVVIISRGPDGRLRLPHILLTSPLALVLAVPIIVCLIVVLTVALIVSLVVVLAVALRIALIVASPIVMRGTVAIAVVLRGIVAIPVLLLLRMTPVSVAVRSLRLGY